MVCQAHGKESIVLRRETLLRIDDLVL